MELEQQLQTLIKDAAEFGIAPIVLQQAVAPVLKLLAQQLNHLEYFDIIYFSTCFSNFELSYCTKNFKNVSDNEKDVINHIKFKN